jgi:hypothetical protein
MKKLVLLALSMFLLTGCELPKSGTSTDIARTQEVGNNLSVNQPTPTDISYSLERYNLIRRAYWVNGMKEKAKTVARPAEVPMGYCVLFTDMGQVLGQFNVDGKVTSLNSYLTADYVQSGNASGYTIETSLPDIDGSYGSNDDGIFFFTPTWKYIEWSGNYLYSDTPFKVSDTVLEDY